MNGVLKITLGLVGCFVAILTASLVLLELMSGADVAPNQFTYTLAVAAVCSFEAIVGLGAAGFVLFLCSLRRS